MKRIEFLRLITDLFKFKTVKDNVGNEYVLYENSAHNVIGDIDDKTAFEAVENHVHIINNVKKAELEYLCICAKNLGEALLSCLKQNFPGKNFVVFVTVGEDFIIRFHQVWENEALYYDTTAEYEKGIKIFMFK